MFLSECQQTVLHRLMTQSTQTHTALDHRTGAVKYWTAGKKEKNCFATVKHKKLKESTIFFFFVAKLCLQYILRGESDMTLDVGQMTLFKKNSTQIGSGISTLLCRYLILI